MNVNVILVLFIGTLIGLHIVNFMFMRTMMKWQTRQDEEIQKIYDQLIQTTRDKIEQLEKEKREKGY